MAFQQRHSSSSSPLFAITACVVWLLFLLLGGGALVVVVFAVEHGVTSNHLRVSIRNNHLLQDSPSCQHSIGQVELLNLVRVVLCRVASVVCTLTRGWPFFSHPY